MHEEVKRAKEPIGDDEEIPAAKSARTPAAKTCDQDEDEEMVPMRRRLNKKRRIQRDSSDDEDEADE